MCGATYAGGYRRMWEDPPGIWGMVPRDPRGRALHSATLRPLGEATAYAGSLAPALRGIDLPGRGRGSSEGMGWGPREDPPQIKERMQGEDPPEIRGRIREKPSKEKSD